MISNGSIRNCTSPTPILHSMLSEAVLSRVETRQIFPHWRGESADQLDHPRLRIGSPVADSQLRSDQVFLILDYLAHNPLLSKLEKRHLVAQRMMSGLHIGQSMDEAAYKDYQLHVAGQAVADDLTLKSSNSTLPVGVQLNDLSRLVATLQAEVIKLKQQLSTESQHI